MIILSISIVSAASRGQVLTPILSALSGAITTVFISVAADQYQKARAHQRAAREKIEALRETHPEIYALADYLDTQGDRAFFLSVVLGLVFFFLTLLLAQFHIGQ